MFESSRLKRPSLSLLAELRDSWTSVAGAEGQRRQACQGTGGAWELPKKTLRWEGHLKADYFHWRRHI